MTPNSMSSPAPGTLTSSTRCPPGGREWRPRSPLSPHRDHPPPADRASRLPGYAAEERRRARLQIRCPAAAVPASHRDHARRHEFEAVEETQDLVAGVDVYLRGGVRRREVLPFGRVAGTDG